MMEEVIVCSMLPSLLVTNALQRPCSTYNDLCYSVGLRCDSYKSAKSKYDGVPQSLRAVLNANSRP